eukprot:GHVS01048028.1.p1 GENE.GHVS01048028.1~~GHVS01048028.1.p1  ORF type:complete len:529 (-),score=81.60 GHVS01048028.1:476-1885(-)
MSEYASVGHDSKDVGLWNELAVQALQLISSLQAKHICFIVRAMAKANFQKHSLCNRLSRLSLQNQLLFTSSQLAQLLKDLQKLSLLDPTVALSFVPLLRRHISAFSTFSLCLVVQTFAAAGVREESLLRASCLELRSSPRRLAELMARRFEGIKADSAGEEGEKTFQQLQEEQDDKNALQQEDNSKNAQQIHAAGGGMRSVYADVSSRSGSHYSLCPTLLANLCKLDFVDPLVPVLLSTHLSSQLYQMSSLELLLIAYAIVAHDMTLCKNRVTEGGTQTKENSPGVGCEVLSICLSRVCRSIGELNSKELQMLRIIGAYIKLGVGPVRARLSSSVLRALLDVERTPHKCPPSPSKMQDRVERLLRQLRHSVNREVPLGPYVVDFSIASIKTVIEVDGYRHYYILTKHRTLKTQLKYRILSAMGWKIVSIPYFDWRNKSKEEKLHMLSESLSTETDGELPSLNDSHELYA